MPPEQALPRSSTTAFLQEVETTAMTKSFKMVLLEALLELDGLTQPPTVEALAARSLEVFRRRRPLIPDIHEDLRDIRQRRPRQLARILARQPRQRLGRRQQGRQRPGLVPPPSTDRFEPQFHVDGKQLETLAAMIQELVDYRLAAYQTRLRDRLRHRRPTSCHSRTGTSAPSCRTSRTSRSPAATSNPAAPTPRNTAPSGPEYGRLDPGAALHRPGFRQLHERRQASDP
ncbi:MAG: hypothetical protein U5L11_14255 [Arhodomonas sp.]|nr:hypothetical protein [Arhodomonas sp.]